MTILKRGVQDHEVSRMRVINAVRYHRSSIDATIVIMKDLPVIQCAGCSEYLLDDAVLERVDAIVEDVDNAAELEVIRYAA